MYNWSTNENVLKTHTKSYALWKLEQRVNFGLNGEKLVAQDLKTY